MGRPAARVTDMHTCPMVTPGTPPIPHVGGPIIPACSPNVLTGGLPQARVTDKAVCIGPMDMIVEGSATVFVNGLPAARMGDHTVHGGVIVTGQLNVLIGDAAGGLGPLAAMAAAFFGKVSRTCQQLAEEQQKLAKAQEMAALSSATYANPAEQRLPPGWSQASKQDLEDLGLMIDGHDLTKIDGSDFRADVFVRDMPDGQKKYVIAFKGTTPTSPDDWQANLMQGMGMDTAYYTQAKEIGRTAASFKPGQVEFTGHSLGGGLASAATAAAYTVDPTVAAHTFNAAGLNSHTVPGYGGRMKDLPIDAYSVDGDILSTVQDVLPFAPEAAGRRISLPCPKEVGLGDMVAGAVGRMLSGPLGIAAFALARGVRLHSMESVDQALEKAQADNAESRRENGCP